MLISSALVNPSDQEATKQIEEEIENVRKEGGLEAKEDVAKGVDGVAVDAET